MSEKKMSKKQYFEQLKKNYNLTADEIKFINHEIELLDKKNSSEKKPTAQQTANKGVATALVNGMETNKSYTITDLIKSIPECADLTNQRVSAIVKQLVEAGKIERFEEKRKAYFRVIR